ncbi:MAG: hypothetical protein GEV08_24710, partial [Acidimicrobiia bacterium]|nr:hypothetical protein [Acidimicrobiia bacterium]
MGLACAGLIASATFAVGAGAAFGDEPALTVVEIPAGVAEAATTAGEVDVIVQLADPAGGLAPAALAADAVATAQAGSQLVAEVGAAAADADVLGNLGVVSMRVSPDQLEQLAKSPLVQRIEPDISFAPALNTVASAVNAGAAWSAGL